MKKKSSTTQPTSGAHTEHLNIGEKKYRKMVENQLNKDKKLCKTSYCCWTCGL